MGVPHKPSNKQEYRLELQTGWCGQHEVRFGQEPELESLQSQLYGVFPFRSPA